MDRWVGRKDVPPFTLSERVVPTEHLREDATPAIRRRECLGVPEHSDYIVVPTDCPQIELLEVVDSTVRPKLSVCGVGVFDRCGIVGVVVDTHLETVLSVSRSVIAPADSLLDPLQRV